MKKALSLILLLSAVFLCSCGREYTCSDILSGMLRVSGSGMGENGHLYIAAADEGEAFYLSQKNVDLLYGEGAYSTYFPLIEDFALFISAHDPLELAVFKCYSTTDCEAVAQMCLRRADSIKITLHGSNYEKRAKGIGVEIYGRTVVFYFAEEARRVSSRVREML